MTAHLEGGVCGRLYSSSRLRSRGGWRRCREGAEAFVGGAAVGFLEGLLGVILDAEETLF
jgi:hypothetical protein